MLVGNSGESNTICWHKSQYRTPERTDAETGYVRQLLHKMWWVYSEELDYSFLAQSSKRKTMGYVMISFEDRKNVEDWNYRTTGVTNKIWA